MHKEREKLMDKSVQLSAEQIIVCEPDFSSKWEPTRNYCLRIKGITIFRGLEANCQWIKGQIETTFAEAYARAAAPQLESEFDWKHAYRRLALFLHRRDEHNQFFERCEDARCNPDNAPHMSSAEADQLRSEGEMGVGESPAAAIPGSECQCAHNHSACPVHDASLLPDNHTTARRNAEQRGTTTPQATCPECGAKSQLTLTATGPWIYITCGACRQWWSIGEIEHTPYFFGGKPASNGPNKVMTCSVDGCTNPSRWQSRCEFHLNEANSATKPESTVAAPQNSERPWIKCSNWLPANNEVVETKVDEGAGVRNEQTLKRQGNLWFFPDGSMHVYYCPTHWRSVNEPRAKV
jgi:hypothetical protein